MPQLHRRRDGSVTVDPDQVKSIGIKNITELRNYARSELNGQIIRIVTGLSGATYNSQLAPMKPTRLEDFLRPEWKGKIASTPYSAGFDILSADQNAKP